MNGSDPLDLAGRRGRTWSLWREASQPEIEALLAAEIAEGRTRWEAAGAIPGFLDAFTMPAITTFRSQGEAQAALYRKLSYYVDCYWPTIIGQEPMPPEGWAQAWAPTGEKAIEIEVEIALFPGIDSAA